MTKLCRILGQDVLFFFQAEDGIRDLYVTGVQTCALPICRGDRDRAQDRTARRLLLQLRDDRRDGERQRQRHLPDQELHDRSEERRVGKGVDIGGRRIIKKKKKKNSSEHIIKEK